MVKNEENSVNSEVKRYSGTVIFTVSSFGSYLSIIPNSDDYASVSTAKLGRRDFVVYDLSNANKWSISDGFKNSSGGQVSNSITIDRNTGNISYKRTFTASNGITIIDTAGGDCSKVDLTKKKF